MRSETPPTNTPDNKKPEIEPINLSWEERMKRVEQLKRQEIESARKEDWRSTRSAFDPTTSMQKLGIDSGHAQKIINEIMDERSKARLEKAHEGMNQQPKNPEN